MLQESKALALGFVGRKAHDDGLLVILCTSNLWDAIPIILWRKSALRTSDWSQYNPAI